MSLPLVSCIMPTKNRREFNSVEELKKDLGLSMHQLGILPNAAVEEWITARVGSARLLAEHLSGVQK